MIEQQVLETKKISSKPQGLPDEKLLKDLGFTKLAKRVHFQKLRAIAYEHYLRLTKEAWEFINCEKNGYTTVSLASYSREIPPPEVLSALKQAQERKCFGSFRVALEGDDPILLGEVGGYIDVSIVEWRPFVIANWGDDFDPKWLESNME